MDRSLPVRILVMDPDGPQELIRTVDHPAAR